MRYEFERNKKSFNSRVLEKRVDRFFEEQSYDAVSQKDVGTIKKSKSFVNKIPVRDNNIRLHKDISKDRIKFRDLNSRQEMEYNMYEHLSNDTNNSKRQFTNKKSTKKQEPNLKLSKVLDKITNKPLGAKQVEDTKPVYL